MLGHTACRKCSSPVNSEPCRMEEVGSRTPQVGTDRLRTMAGTVDTMGYGSNICHTAKSPGMVGRTGKDGLPQGIDHSEGNEICSVKAEVEM